MRHHDQSYDRASHWTSLACVSIRFGSLLARIVSVIGLSVERTSFVCYNILFCIAVKDKKLKY